MRARNNFATTINRASKEELKKIAFMLANYIEAQTLDGYSYMNEMFKTQETFVIYSPETIKSKATRLYNDAKFRDVWFDPEAIIELAVLCGPRSTAEIAFYLQNRFGKLELEGHIARMNRVIREVLSLCGFRNVNHARIEVNAEGVKTKSVARRWQLTHVNRLISIEQLLSTFNAVYAQNTKDFNPMVDFNKIEI